MPTSPVMSSSNIPKSLARADLRDMLLAAGVGSFVAQSAILYMNYLPGTTEPYAQGVREIIMGLQRLLRMQGQIVEVDGGFGATTVDALKKFAGPLWYEKSWAQLYQDVIIGKPWQGFKRSDTGRYGILTRGRVVTPIERDTAYGAEQGMGSYMHGLGDVAADSWTLRSGVAIPLAAVTLVLFQQLQRQVNAINAKIKLPLIAVDGRIGPATAKAVGVLSLKYGSGERAGGDFTPSYVASKADGISVELSGVMTMLGASYVADPKTSSPPSVATASGTVINPADGPSATTLVIGAVAVGAAIALLGKGGKNRKRRK